jgi:REP element-mobilizing transposase RayT
MANAYHTILIHAVFSTKNREPWLTPAVRERLFPYLGGIARQQGMKMLAVGGVADHLHLLLSLSRENSVAEAMRVIKGSSSKWIHETFPQMAGFGWQEGYGAFSLGISQAEETRRYIEAQEIHHRKMSFQEEYLAFLKKHNIQYDERYVWG